VKGEIITSNFSLDFLIPYFLFFISNFLIFCNPCRAWVSEDVENLFQKIFGRETYDPIFATRLKNGM
jgi:hypothetical protein